MPAYILDRIVLLGRGGAGKTTLARRLGEVVGAKVVVLDEIWLSDWSDADLPRFRALVEEAHRGDRWVSDGNFAVATFDIRLPRATLVVWVEESPVICSLRALKRVFKRGETHRLRSLFAVWRFIWRFDRVNRPRIERLRLEHGAGLPVLALNGKAEVERFLFELAPND